MEDTVAEGEGKVGEEWDSWSHDIHFKEPEVSAAVQLTFSSLVIKP